MPVSEVSGLTLIIPGTRSGWCDCGKQKKPPDKRLLSGDGGIRTLVPRRANAFRVRPVMTTSIRLHEELCMISIHSFYIITELFPKRKRIFQI